MLKDVKQIFSRWKRKDAEIYYSDPINELFECNNILKHLLYVVIIHNYVQNNFWMNTIEKIKPRQQTPKSFIDEIMMKKIMLQICISNQQFHQQFHQQFNWVRMIYHLVASNIIILWIKFPDDYHWTQYLKYFIWQN